MKRVTVEAMFPELKGGAIYRTGRGRASTAKVAIGRAFGDVLKQNKGKRYHTITATVTIFEEKPINEQTDEGQAEGHQA